MVTGIMTVPMTVTVIMMRTITMMMKGKIGELREEIGLMSRVLTMVIGAFILAVVGMCSLHLTGECSLGGVLGWCFRGGCVSANDFVFVLLY